MARKSANAQSGPSGGIQQAPTAPSVSAQANNSEAAKALGKSGKKKRKHREPDGLTSGVSNQSLVSEPTEKTIKKHKRGSRGSRGRGAGDAAPADATAGPSEPKKKKSRQPKVTADESSSQPSKKQNGLPESSSLNASTSSNSGNSGRRYDGNRNGRGGGSARGSRESTVIGTGYFVSDSLPQNGKKRKFDQMMQAQVGARGQTPWCADIDWFSASNMTQLLNDEILACSAWISPTYEEHETRSMMISKIRRTIQMSDRNAQVYAFGSHETKLYLPGGDIDIVVDSSSVSTRDPRSFFTPLCSSLVRQGICRYQDIERVFSARVPIIKIRTVQGNIKIDISLYNTNGVKAGEVVKQYLDALPAARPLVLLVKAYMWRIGKNEVFTGGMGSYSTICLAISFLQQHPKIRNNEIDPMKNLGILLIEFFELYGLVFNWEDLGISIRAGGSYFNKRDRNWYKHGPQPNIAIEDPQDQLNDISKGTYQTYSILESFRTAYETLRANIEKRAEELRTWQAMPRSGSGPNYHPKWIDSGGRFLPQRMSLLRDVIGFDEDTLRHRSGLRKLYNVRELHKELNIRWIQPPMTAQQAQATQPRVQTAPSADNFSVNLATTARPALVNNMVPLHEKKDTVLAIMMDESDPEDVGQGDKNAATYFDSDSELSDGGHREKSRPQPPRRRIMTPPDSPSSSSDADVKSVIEVSDEESDEESTRYRRHAKRRHVKGSKEVEMALGSGDGSDSDGVIDVDDESDGIEIVEGLPGVTGSDVPVVHFSETTTRPREEWGARGHTFRPSDTTHQGRHATTKTRETQGESEERVSPPLKRSRPSKTSRQQFWQSKSGVDTGSSRRDQNSEQSGQFEEDWQADLERARADVSGQDAVAANDDFIAF